MKKKLFIPLILFPLLLLAFLLSAPVFSPDSRTDGEAAAAVGTAVPAPEAAGEPSPAPADEPSPTPTPEPTPTPFQEYDITLMALGDNLMHMGIVYTGKQSDGTFDYSFLFQGISEFLSQSDIRIINQETILGGNELGFSGFPHFNSPTQVGDAIADAGFNVVLQASNHAADQGLNGILNCASFWKTNHPEVLMTGIAGEEGFSGIPLLSVGDIIFAILNYTYGPNMEILPNDIKGHLKMLCAYNENGYIDFTSLNPQVTEDIRAARELADIVIVCPHWGNEYQRSPSTYQQRFAMEMTEAGADLIIGTHPHVPQSVEWVTSENGNTSLCYYSLGNYVSTQKEMLAMLEEMAWVTFHVTEDGVAISKEKTGVVPLVCHYKSGPVRLEQVYLLEDYTKEDAARHGILNYGGIHLRLEDLQLSAEDIFGDWILKKSDILTASTPDIPPREITYYEQ